MPQGVSVKEAFNLWTLIEIKLDGVRMLPEKDACPRICFLLCVRVFIHTYILYIYTYICIYEPSQIPTKKGM